MPPQRSAGEATAVASLLLLFSAGILYPPRLPVFVDTLLVRRARAAWLPG